MGRKRRKRKHAHSDNGRYCLYCFYPIKSENPKSPVECPNCNANNNYTLWKNYWIKQPRLVAIENTLKILSILFVFSLTVLLVFLAPNPFSNRMFYACPILLLAAMWNTCSKITSKGVYFSATVFWGVFLSIIGLVLWNYVNKPFASGSGIIYWGVYSVCILIVFGTNLYFRKWEKTYIKNAQNRLRSVK